MEPTFDGSLFLPTTQLIEFTADEELEFVRQLESVNKTIDFLEGTLIRNTERVSNIRRKSNEETKRTLKILPFMFFSAGCAGLFLRVSQDIDYQNLNGIFIRIAEVVFRIFKIIISPFFLFQTK